MPQGAHDRAGVTFLGFVVHPRTESRLKHKVPKIECKEEKKYAQVWETSLWGLLSFLEEVVSNQNPEKCSGARVMQKAEGSSPGSGGNLCTRPGRKNRFEELHVAGYGDPKTWKGREVTHTKHSG